MVLTMLEANPKIVGRRLRALMKDLELETALDLAKAVGGERSKVSNWLNGYNLPPVPEMAKLLQRRPGLTLDWIYLGVADALPLKLAIKLQALMAGMAVPVTEPAPKEDEGAASPIRTHRAHLAHRKAT